MMKPVLVLAAAAGLALSATGAQAQQFNRKDPVTLSSGTGYILYRTARGSEMMFLRETAPGLVSQNPVRIVGARPVVKDDPAGGHYFMIGVQPGTYVVYGMVYIGMDGWAGVCMCMGSVKFEVAPGRVADVGELSFTYMGGMFGNRVSGATLASLSEQGITTLRINPNPPGWVYPARIAGLPIQPALFQAAAKVPNFYGVQIDRLTPIAGVLDYRRDQVIDVRTGQALP